MSHVHRAPAQLRVGGLFDWDIVEGDCPDCLAREAEFEKKDRDVTDLSRMLDHEREHTEELVAEFVRQEERIERLREALRRIAAPGSVAMEDLNSPEEATAVVVSRLMDCHRVAREALSSLEGGDKQ